MHIQFSSTQLARSVALERNLRQHALEDRKHLELRFPQERPKKDKCKIWGENAYENAPKSVSGFCESNPNE